MPNAPHNPLSPEDLARCLWTIGDDTRLRILQLLPKDLDCSKAMNVSQLAEELELTQPTISNHLARLRTLGIVRHKKMCRDVFYWIDQDKASVIIEALSFALKIQEQPAHKK